MSKLVLYPQVARRFEDSKKWKKVCVVPNQSMSLHEVFRRFIKREALPAMKEGVYHEGEYDLEKVSKMDRTEMEDILPKVKAEVVAKAERVKQESAKRVEGERAKRKAELQEMLKELKQEDPKV